jgi:hypothetical protein
MNDVHLPKAGMNYTHTLRVTFSYTAKEIRIARVQRVAMRVPAPVTPPPGEKHVGYWLAVEDAAGRLLYHYPIHDPLKLDVEVFDDSRGGKPFRLPASQSSGEFEILVPDVPHASRLVLNGTLKGAKPTAKASHTLSAPLVSHSLDELRQLAFDSASKPQGGRP